MSVKNILITGCNRGIGLGLVKQLIKEPSPPAKLIATCRSIEKAKELKAIADTNSNVHLLQLDVKDFDKYGEFAKDVSEIVGDDGLNVLINNAGISTKFTRINLVKVKDLMDNYAVNTVAPIMLSSVLKDLLKKASAQSGGKTTIINLSSILASIESNYDGGFYPYRCSKAALNMATKSMSVDLKSYGVIAAAIHPGWVKTDMGGSKAPIEVEESAKGILDFVKNINESHSGNFYEFNGKPLLW